MITFLLKSGSKTEFWEKKEAEEPVHASVIQTNEKFINSTSFSVTCKPFRHIGGYLRHAAV